MPQAWVRAFLDANKEVGAKVLLKRLGDLCDLKLVKLAEYDKGGFVADLEMPIAEGGWPAQVFDLLKKAQLLGRGWHIGGVVDDDVDLATDKLGISGVKMMTISIRKNGA